MQRLPQADLLKDSFVNIPASRYTERFLCNDFRKQIYLRIPLYRLRQADLLKDSFAKLPQVIGQLVSACRRRGRGPAWPEFGSFDFCLFYIDFCCFCWFCWFPQMPWTSSPDCLDTPRSSNILRCLLLGVIMSLHALLVVSTSVVVAFDVFVSVVAFAKC